MIFKNEIGSLHYGNITILPLMKLEVIMNILDLRKIVDNYPWITYDHFSEIEKPFRLIIKTHENIIIGLEIYLELERILDKGFAINILESKLEEWGGECKYTWGFTEIDKDNKGGIPSIVVTFLKKDEQVNA